MTTTSNVETDIKRILTQYTKNEMVALIGAQEEKFEALLKLAISNERTYSWRAAWILCSCMQQNDSRVQKYIPHIMEAIPYRKDGHQRELLNVINKMHPDETLEGQLFDLCISLWEKIHKQPSVRYTAFRIILGIVEKYPEMKQEASFLMQQEYIETLSPGIKNALIRQYHHICG